jgi:DNA-binding helix-hairpin-helix protein with protein kinase domain
VIKSLVKALLTLTGIFSLFKCSSGYNEKEGKITFNGEEITAKNFVVLNEVFAKDDSIA